MSLQTRLATLVSAIGADIKSDRARLTVLEGTPARQVQRGAIQNASGYSNLVSGTLPGATQRVDFTVPAGTYIVMGIMSAYHTAVTSAHWNIVARKPDGTYVTVVVDIGFYLNQANVHETSVWGSGEITVTAGTLSIYPAIGGLSTTLDDRFDVILIPKDVSGPPGATGPQGPVGLPPVVAKANRTTTAALTPTVVTRLAFPNEISDDSNIFDGQVFQPTRAGWYRITSTLFVDNLTGTNSLLSLYLVKNSTGHNYPTTGTLETQDNKMVFPAQGEINAVLDVDQLVFFNGTTDFVELYAAFSVSGRVGTGSTWFQAESVGAAGPQGVKGDQGDKGDKGDAGRDGDALIPARIDWTALPISTGGGGWPAESGGTPPAWMLSSDGIVHVRGRVTANSGTSGVDLSGMSPLFEPFTDPLIGNRVYIPGVNHTTGVLGYWEILSSGLLWHGAKTNGDKLGFDGLSWPSAIGGPLGTLISPSMASGWSSDPTNPLMVYTTGKEVRISGAIIGSLPAAGSDLFTVAGLTSHARTVVAVATVQTISGPQHPDTTGVVGSGFTMSAAGLFRKTALYGGTNQVKITFTGAYTKP